MKGPKEIGPFLTRRVLLQGASALAASSALAATATGKIALTNTAWTDLGAGPMTLRFAGDGVYAIGDAAPAFLGEGFTIRTGKSALVDTPSHVWAMARGNAGVSAYTSPYTGGSGGGPTSVWSAADATAGGMTLSNGGLTVTPSGAASWAAIRTSISKTAGKLYVEFLATAGMSAPNLMFGLASASFSPGNYLGTSTYSAGEHPWFGDGSVSSGFTLNYSPNAVPTQNDVWALAIDFATGNVWIANNNSWYTGNPATGALPAITFVPATVGPLFPAISFNGTVAGVGAWTLQATAASQKYAPPSGFTPWG